MGIIWDFGYNLEVHVKFLKILIVICMNDTHRKGHMYTFRTMSNRQPKRKSAEATGAGAGDNNKEEAGGPKKTLAQRQNTQAKYTRKMQDHDMTKEVISSFLTNEEDEIEITPFWLC